MASKVICSITVLLLAVIAFASMFSASLPLTPTDHTDAMGMSNLLPVQHGLDKKVEEAKAREHGGASATKKVGSLVSREEEEKKTGSHWDKVKKLDDDDDDNSDHDHDSDSDHDHDHDSDSDHDHDSDSDHDHDHDSDDDSKDDDDNDHDHDSDDDSSDGDDHHNSKNGSKKKHPSHRRKGPPRSNQDDELLKVEIKV